MSKLQFKCTLLTDVIINQKAATDGNQESSDFIPGNNFLGIAASIYKDLEPKEQLLVFHSGKVRFSDAHPLYDNFRTLRIPAIMQYPKGEKVSDNDCCYLYHKHERGNDDKQLKQCRQGFYKFQNDNAQEVEVLKTFAIKSAYDSEKRRSRDMQMYGYQSIDERQIFCFEVYFDDSPEIDNLLKNKIKDALIGEKRVGRSRTAQYGLVSIEPFSFEEVPSDPNADKSCVTVYADGRLIFLDENGVPIFMPDVAQLGFPNGKIIWEKSQIRTFQYAPWNSKRQARDSDRCGIEKGSVFVLSVDEIPAVLPQYIGSYKNEGFGKIIINPDFLNVKEGKNGLAKYSFIEKKASSKVEKKATGKVLSTYDIVVFDYLQSAQKEEKDNQEIYQLVNQYVTENENKFVSDSETFSSQWGSIRRIAENVEDLKKELFDKDTGYLCSGIAKEKWDDCKRRKSFEEFCNGIRPEIIQRVVINLAAEMAKKCSSNKNKTGGKKNG
jgi:hypothetical protein